jgi:hypothetical protein
MVKDSADKACGKSGPDVCRIEQTCDRERTEMEVIDAGTQRHAHIASKAEIC